MRRGLAVLLFGFFVCLAARAEAGPFSWLWPFSKPVPAKKHGKGKQAKGHTQHVRPKTPLKPS
jgi:hypothetical protein